METTSMGKVVVTARIENLEDLFNAERGLIATDDVRSIEVVDALVDTGATGLLVPKPMIARLGLTPLRMRQARGLGGTVPLPTKGKPCNDAWGQRVQAFVGTAVAGGNPIFEPKPTVFFDLAEAPPKGSKVIVRIRPR